MAITKRVVKKTTYVKRGAKKPSVNLAALQKKVNQLALKEKSHICKVMYGQANASVVLGNLAGDSLTTIPLTQFTAWSRIFGTDADDEQAKKASIRNVNMQYSISTTEADPVGISMFVVSLKSVASDLLVAGGSLGTLTNGTHYYGNGNKVLLNMNFFNIHHVKRIIMGSQSIARPASGANPALQNIPSETGSLFKKGRFSILYNKGRGLNVSNPAGDWKAGSYPKSDTQNYFWLIFTDDSTADAASPTLSYNAVNTVEVVA
jgi:hypothetical protein